MNGVISSNIEEKSYFDGGLLQLIGWKILGILITIFTLGICYPWACCMVYNWEIKHTVINGKRLKFDGTAIQLFGNWIKWWLLTIITLGIYSFWLGIAIKKWKTKHTHFANLSQNQNVNLSENTTYNTRVQKYNNEKETFSNIQILGIFFVLMLIPFSIYCFNEGITGLIDSKENEVEETKLSNNNNIIDTIKGKKTMVCTKSETDENGMTSKYTVKLTYKNSIVKEYESTSIIETDSNYIDISISFSKLFTDKFSEFDGITMTTKKLSDTTYELYSKIVYDDINEEQLKTYLASLEDDDSTDYSIYKKQSINIDEYKNEFLNDFICE